MKKLIFVSILMSFSCFAYADDVTQPSVTIPCGKYYDVNNNQMESEPTPVIEVKGVKVDGSLFAQLSTSDNITAIEGKFFVKDPSGQEFPVSIDEAEKTHQVSWLMEGSAGDYYTNVGLDVFTSLRAGYVLVRMQTKDGKNISCDAELLSSK